MLYTHNPKENDYNIDIIGDPENGCILPPGEYKKLKEDPTLLYSLEQYTGASQAKILEALDIRATQYFKPDKNLYRHGYLAFHSVHKGKERGGFRPHRALKEIQVLLHKRLLSIPISTSITSGNRYRKGDAVSNAKKHRYNPYTITLDVKKAYPSTNTHRIYKNIEGALFRNLDILAPLLSTHEQKQRFIRSVTHLLVWNDHLPEGAPTSPAVFDIIASKLDAVILKKMVLEPINNPLITRYRDDITLSFKSHRGRILQSIKELGDLRYASFLPSKSSLGNFKITNNNKHADVQIYKFIKGISGDTSIQSHTLLSKDYTQIATYLRDKSDDTTNTHLMQTKENLRRYMDMILERTQNIVDELYSNVAITNDTDQTAIQTDLLTFKDNLQMYFSKYDIAYGLNESHKQKLLAITGQIINKPIHYPNKTIGDVSQFLCEVLRDEGYKVNMKKLKMQSPGSPFPIEITGVAKMADGALILPKKLMLQYSLVVNNLLKLNSENLQAHPYYKKKFFTEEYFSSNKEKIYNYLKGIRTYIIRIYGQIGKAEGSNMMKLGKNHTKVLRRWANANSREEIDDTADEKYNASYQYGVKEDNNKNEGGAKENSEPPKSIDDLLF